MSEVLTLFEQTVHIRKVINSALVLDKLVSTYGFCEKDICLLSMLEENLKRKVYRIYT